MQLKIYSTMDFAKSGQDAIDMCREQGRCCSPYKVIFIFIQLEDMNGLEKTKAIRQLKGYDDTKIFAITEPNHKLAKTKLDEAGINGVLYMPLDKTEMIKFLNENHIF